MYDYSNGIGNDIVRNYYDVVPPKSIGNSTTCYKDLTSNREVKEVFCTIASSVVSRMIQGGHLNAKTLKIWVKDSALESFGKLPNFVNAHTVEFFCCSPANHNQVFNGQIPHLLLKILFCYNSNCIWFF